MTGYKIELGGAITVLNGMGIGIGAAMGTELQHRLEIKETDGIKLMTKPTSDTKLLEKCISQFSDNQDIEVDNIKLSTDLAYDGAKGMKTSSIVATGTIYLLSKFFEQQMSDKDIINLGANASIDAGVSITGAIDDAHATYYGDFWVTHNLKREILAHHNLDLGKSVIFIQPEEKNLKSEISLNLEFLDKYVLKDAVKQALNGDWKSAIEKNSRVFGQFFLNDWDIINSMEDIVRGTIGLNGAGPSLFLVCDEEYSKENITTLSKNFSNYNYVETKLR